MMIKVSGDYLDFDGDIQIERQVKTQDTISNAGDFSYSFDIPVTSKNLNLLGIQSINIANKAIYNKSDVSIEVNGIAYYHGFLQVSASNHRTLSATFFSGNSGWFSLINDKFIYQLSLDRYKIKVIPGDDSNLRGTWTKSEWIVYPLVDKGLLQDSKRNFVSYSNAYIEPDLIPFVYVKSLFKGIFGSLGIKTQGTLFSDALFGKLIIGTSSKSGEQQFINNRNCFVGKTASQSIGTSTTLVTFTNTNLPYFVDPNGNYNSTLSKYVIDNNEDVQIDLALSFSASKTYTVLIYQNGSLADGQTTTDTGCIFSYQSSNAKAGDYFEVYMSITSGTVNVTGDIRYTIYRVNDIYPQFIVGTLKQGELVKAVFQMFNVIAQYNSTTATLTCDLFKDLESNAEDDWTEYVKELKFNYTDVLANYSKKNILAYKSGSDINTTTYNNINVVPYGGGSIDIDNDFLTGVNSNELKFTSSFNNYNLTIGANLMNLGIQSFEVPKIGTISISGVTNNAGKAHFTTSTAHNLSDGDYVYIVSTSTGGYLGLGLIITSFFSTTEFEFFGNGSDYVTNATGTCEKVTITNKSSDNIYVGINFPNIAVSDFARASTINFNGGTYSNIAWAYFAKQDIGRNPVDSFKHGLAFDKPNLSGYTGTTLIDEYYALNKRILNDPVKCFATMVLPYKEFVNLDFSKPKRIKMNNVDMKCFVNRITGYKDGSTDCTVELIKI